MGEKYLINMKKIRLFSIERCPDNNFKYPCVDSNTDFLAGKNVCIFDESGLIKKEWFFKSDATLKYNPSNDETSFAQVGIICPCVIENDDREAYFKILDYYISLLQLLIYKMKWTNDFSHIVVVLPAESDVYSTSLSRMAFYSIYGLIKGVAETNAPYGVYINGIILSKDYDEDVLKDWVTFLSSDNANNIIGQLFKI